MTQHDLTHVASDNAITRRERERQSAYREQVLELPAGERIDREKNSKKLGNYLRADHWRSNFLSPEAADYAATRAEVVKREGGQLEQTRLFTNMLSSMPLAFSVFGHLRAHPGAALVLLSSLIDQELVGLDTVTVGERTIRGIECEWAPRRQDHLDDGTAFDAVVAARTRDGRRLLIAVEVKYVDTFSRDASGEAGDKDAKYRRFCQDFGMADGAYDALNRPQTKQLLRNALLTESVRRGSGSGVGQFDEAVTVVFARDDDEAAKAAVADVERHRGAMPTRVSFVGHGEFAQAAAAVDDLADWSAQFRRRYLPGAAR